MSSFYGLTNLNWEYCFNPRTLERVGRFAQSYGTLIAGALFGAGWWFWADACVVSPSKVPFDQYIPGIIATLALLMINAIRRDELQEYDAFDDAGYCRPRFWLFLSYVVSFGSIVGAVWVMVQHYSQTDLSQAEKWPGVAGIFQVILILGSGLLLFVSRAPSEDAGFNGYSSF